MDAKFKQYSGEKIVTELFFKEDNISLQQTTEFSPETYLFLKVQKLFLIYLWVRIRTL